MVNILVVDDDKNIRKLMRAVFETEGYGVYLAEDGDKALEVIDSVKIDLAIVDPPYNMKKGEWDVRKPEKRSGCRYAA